MQRCTKCHRTYRDDDQRFCTFDGGRLVSDSDMPTAIDLNKTVHSRRSEAEFDQEETLIAKPVDSYKTVQGVSALHGTSEIPPPAITGQTSASESIPWKPAEEAELETSSSYETSHSATTPISAEPLAPTAQPLPQSPSAQAGQPPSVQTVQPVKRAVPVWVWLILALVVSFGILSVGAVAIYFLMRPQPAAVTSNANVIPPAANKSERATVETEPEPGPNDTVEPPPRSLRFENSRQKLDGKLVENYVDFSFYYPISWIADPSAGVPGASNYVRVERRIPPDYTQESFAVSWYESGGTFERDSEVFRELTEKLSGKFSGLYPEYRKVSEGETKFGIYSGYEFRFEAFSRKTEKGDIRIWGRVIFLPAGFEGHHGVTLLMLATSLAPELKSIDDVGEQGQLPIILNTFRLGKTTDGTPGA